MRSRLRSILFLLGIVLMSAPLSVFATLLLLPFWSWLEASAGIESVGHSGPAEWCYLATFIVLLSIALAIWLFRRSGSAQ